jgi:HPt (histidine-containing phosphotransfer) domain-containing protein
MMIDKTFEEEWAEAEATKGNPQKTHQLQTEKLYNTALLDSITKNDPVFLKRMLNIFVKHMTVTMNELSQSLAGNDLKRIQNAAHKAIPGIEDMCFDEMIQLIHDIAEHAEGGTSSSLDQNIQNFNGRMAIVIAHIKETALK